MQQSFFRYVWSAVLLKKNSEGAVKPWRYKIRLSGSPLGVFCIKDLFWKILQTIKFRDSVHLLQSSLPKKYRKRKTHYFFSSIWKDTSVGIHQSRCSHPEVFCDEAVCKKFRKVHKNTLLLRIKLFTRKETIKISIKKRILQKYFQWLYENFQKNLRNFKAVVQKCSSKEELLKISQISQENTCVGVSY